MANTVSIWITNKEGRHFELSNTRMTLMEARSYHQMNWKAALPWSKVTPHDVILWDGNDGIDAYRIVQHCKSKDEAEKIITSCRKKLHDQYERHMEIRVAKKYQMNPKTLLRLEQEYHNPENYEVKL